MILRVSRIVTKCHLSAIRSDSFRRASTKYRESLNLPKTAFPLSMKDGVVPQRELKVRQASGFDEVYQWQRDEPRDKEFILHDGPPYANGQPHVGHVLNKVLKDITVKYKILTGHRVHYVPGWDCHGVPIEQKALADLRTDSQKLSPLEIRSKAHHFASDVISQQNKAFQSWGVTGDWQNPYVTFDPKFEAEQLRVFFQMYEKGMIYQDYMPVYWSPSSGTALAEAELEYNDQHRSTAIYVKFPLRRMPDILWNALGKDIEPFALIWTTTPWTLPANQAICYGSNISYCFAHNPKTREAYLIAVDFVEQLKQILNTDLNILLTISGSDLEGTTYRHPCMGNRKQKLLPSTHVTVAKGTGLVHTAPAHGPEDFQVAINNQLPVLSLVDREGVFTAEAGSSLASKYVLDEGNKTVLSLMREQILHREEITHSYPYDWRTKKPVIFRASKQWFVNTTGIQDKALECLEDVKVFPSSLSKSMQTTLKARSYWCISRQRAWGVPIPVFYHKESGKPLMGRSWVDHVVSLVEKHGTDCWWSMPVDQLLPKHIIEECGGNPKDAYVKESDVLDIWFDSGSSWAAVLKECGGRADLYLEGLDQLGGWFLSSLITSMVTRGVPPYKNLMIHGFVVDEDGHKMSKSVGNVIDPQLVINGSKAKGSQQPAYGVDVLRWWVAQSGLDPQVSIGPSVLARCHEQVFKMRKTFRYLLGNLSDFDPEIDKVAYSDLRPQDKYMLHLISELSSQVTKDYEVFNYSAVLRTLEIFNNSQISAFYSNITKDRLYCNLADSVRRRACQTVQYELLSALTYFLAPVLPHLAEEVFQHPPFTPIQNSIFKTEWYEPDPSWNQPHIVNMMNAAFCVRDKFNMLITSENPVQFHVIICAKPHLFDCLKMFQDEATSSSSSLCEILQSSYVTLFSCPPVVIPDEAYVVDGTCTLRKPGENDVTELFQLVVLPSEDFLCERCRLYTSDKKGELCQRCDETVLAGWDR